MQTTILARQTEEEFHDVFCSFYNAIIKKRNRGSNKNKVKRLKDNK